MNLFEVVKRIMKFPTSEERSVKKIIFVYIFCDAKIYRVYVAKMRNNERRLLVVSLM